MTEFLRTRRNVLLVVCCAALVGLAAGCGGSSSASGVPKDDVAAVDGQPISYVQFQKALDQYNRGAKAAGQSEVKKGDKNYDTTVQTKLMPYLIQREEFEQQAKKLGVVVTKADIDAQVKKIIDQYFNGDKKKFLAAVKKQGSTVTDVRESISLNILQQKVTKKLTSGVKVTDKEALDYYNKNKAQYEHPTSRDLSHILVKTKAKAQSIYNQLAAGASFATLAKKYSTDKGSAVQGGKLGVQAENALVKPFSKVAFAIKTGTISKPVKSQFGWHIIKANGPVKAAYTSPFSKEKAGIVQQLKQAKDADATTAFQTTMGKFYAKRVKYQNGYAPPAPTTPTATSVIPTTATGG
jgi:foldase protein PrsA